MKSLLTAVTIVAVLCLVSVAAPQEKATTTVYLPIVDEQPERARRVPSDLFQPEWHKSDQLQDGADQDPELREEYLHILQERIDGMSNNDLRLAIREARAETQWLRAKEKLQEATDILAGIYTDYRGTERAADAEAILQSLVGKHGFDSQQLKASAARN